MLESEVEQLGPAGQAPGDEAAADAAGRDLAELPLEPLTVAVAAPEQPEAAAALPRLAADTLEAAS